MDKFWIKCVELLNLSKNLVKIIYWYEHRSKKKAKKFLSWWIMQFWKNYENGRKHRDVKFVATENRRDYLVSEPNYHTTKFFTEHLLAIEMKKSRY